MMFMQKLQLRLQWVKKMVPDPLLPTSGASSPKWGVGYIVVRYRKNGVLKRLKATPLTSLEYLAAQTLSRIFLLMFTLVVVWVGCDLVFSFHMEGSYIDLFIVFFMGGASLTSFWALDRLQGYQ